MRKEGGWQWYNFIGLAFSYSRCDFQTNRCRPHPVRGIKLFSEPCFYYLQTIIDSQHRTTNCWRYLNFADFLGNKGEGQHLLVVLKRLADFWSCITEHCNDAKVTTARLPISVKYLYRSSKHRADLSRYLKRFIMESRSLPTFQISRRMYNTDVSIRCMMWKVCRSPTLCRYLKTIIVCQ